MRCKEPAKPAEAKGSAGTQEVTEAPLAEKKLDDEHPFNTNIADSEGDTIVGAATVCTDTPVVEEGAQVDNGVARGKISKEKPKLPKPTGIQPCPRCGSTETKFCCYNNYNIKQPRYYCKDCQRYWTAGGTLRDVPVGAGRRKSNAKFTRSDGGFEPLSGSLAPMPLTGMLPAGMPLDPTMFTAINMSAGALSVNMMPGLMSGMTLPPVAGVMPPPPMAFPQEIMRPGLLPGMGDSRTKASANAISQDPAAFAGTSSLRAGGTLTQKRETMSGLTDGTEGDDLEGRRTRQRTEGPNTQVQSQPRKPAAHPESTLAATVSGDNMLPQFPPPAAGSAPMYSMEWFQANPQAAAAMQAQFQVAAAAAGTFGMPGSWPYRGGFPGGWPGYAVPPAIGPHGIVQNHNHNHEAGAAGHQLENSHTQAFPTAPLTMPAPPMPPGMAWPGQWPMFHMPISSTQTAAVGGTLPIPVDAAGALPAPSALGHMVPNATPENEEAGGIDGSDRA